MTRARRLALLLAGAAALAISLAPAAEASYPGTNGRIAFTEERGIYTMNPDGSDVQPVVEPLPVRGAPAWSPDGTKIAYWHTADLYVVNPDGTGEVAWTSTPASETREVTPAWSPDGTKLVFASTVSPPTATSM